MEKLPTDEEGDGLTAPLLPQLFCQNYSNYDTEERAHHRFLTRVNVAGVFLVTAAYSAIVLLAAQGCEPPPAPPPWVRGTQILFATLAAYVQYAQLFVTVQPAKAGGDEYAVSQGPFGRFIWLTHQTITIVAVHSVLSVAAPYVSDRLAAGTYVAAVIVGGFGSFVTIQFFSLVRGSPDYAVLCRTWASRNIHYKTMNDILHVPHLFFALLDVCVFKHHATLLVVMPAIWAIIAFVVAYCLAYVGMLHFTHSLTACWPYGFLKDLGSSPAKWAQFVVVQCTILVALCLVLWALPHVLPAAW